MVREQRARRPQSRGTPKRTTSPGSIWDTPRIKKMAAEPFGSPIVLTKKEAIAIAKESFGRGRGRFPSGREYVHQMRHLWKGFVKPRNG